MLTRLMMTILIMLAFFASWLAAPASPAVAQKEPIQGPPAPVRSSDQACIVLIQDQSGSMKTSDPTYLRDTSVRLFISLLDENDQVGLIRFSTTVTPLTSKMVTLRSANDKQTLLNLLQNTPPDGYTDIQAALKTAVNLMQGCVGERWIVLLSDGQPELPNGVPLTYAKETLDLIKTANIPVLSIALTASGESGLMYQLANISTPRGSVIPARTASDLVDAYLEALARLKDRSVMNAGQVSAPANGSFILEAGLAQYLNRITFIISKPAGVTVTLRQPGGEPLSANDPSLVFSYTRDPGFSVYTIQSPAPGNWQAQLAGSGVAQLRAILRSRLRVVVLQPGAYAPQSAPLILQASLVEEDASGKLTTLIGKGAFSAQITRPDGSQDALDALYDDGTHGDQRANDGIFSNIYVKTDLAGEYRITLTGYKGPIPVKTSLRVIVVPFPQIIPTSPGAGILEVRGQPVVVSMRLQGGEPPTLDSGSFFVRITPPDGKVTNLDLQAGADGFSATFTPTQDGIHKITFLAREGLYKGIPYNPTAERSVDLRRIPAIRIDAPQTLEPLEMRLLEKGIPLQIRVTSTSAQPETLKVELGGVPGLQVSSVSPAQIPSGETTLYITLKGVLPPGSYSASLLFTARAGVDLAQRSLPLNLQVFQPAIEITPLKLDLAYTLSQIAAGQRVELTLVSHSLKDENLTLTWEGSPGIVMKSAPVLVPAGKSIPIQLEVSGAVPAGQYSGKIGILAREGVDAPAEIALNLVVKPKTWMEVWGFPTLIGSGILAAAGLGTLNHFSRKIRPWGSLRPQKIPAGQTVGEIQLGRRTRLFKPALAIGSSAGSGIRLMGGKVQPNHAEIRVEPREIAEKVGKPPRMLRVQRQVNIIRNLGSGIVRVNHLIVPQGQISVPLKTGTPVEIGEYEFTYHE